MGTALFALRARALTVLLLCGIAAATAAACTGPAGITGPEGPAGIGHDGDDGKNGENGTDGDAGTPGRNAYITGSGLELQILDAHVADTDVAEVTFSITDGAGLPLDREGLYTEGAVDVRFVIAWLDQTAGGGALQYTSYTIKPQTSPINGTSADQAAADEGGTFEEVDVEKGIYRYTFATPVKVADPAKTHTVGAWATRQFQGARYVANALHDFVPEGGAPTVIRDVVQTAACNTCHNPISAHGGARREVGLCVLCHSPQTTDPDTGNTTDFRVMIHKIHRGRALPSVLAGKPYQIIGFQQSVHDYSTVVYPQELQNCAGCHTGSQGDNWKNVPTRAACGSCHDQISFVEPAPQGMTMHTGGVMADDSKCNVCHPPAGGLEGIATQHLTPLLDPKSPKIEISIASVANAGPGQKPEILFSVKVDGAPVDILATPLTRIVVTVAGPTTDYATFNSYTIQGTGASGTLVAQGGSFLYTLPVAMAAGAAGTYAFGIEAYQQASGGPRFSAKNVVAFAAVTDAAPVPRRVVVELDQCNNCHGTLAAHGGARNEPQYCALCHNPNNVNDDRVSRFEGQSIVAPSVDFRTMIHRIHMGEELTQKPSLLYGFPQPSAANPAGTPIDFSEVRYPGDRKACWSCHAGQSYALPLPSTLLPTKTGQLLQCTEDPAADADSYCNTRVVAKEFFMGPTAAACTGCHDAPHVAAHAETNTSAGGVEACATCHGPGADHDVQRVHAPAP